MTRRPSRMFAAEGVFGRSLRAAREARGMQAFDLSVAAGLSRSHISRLERDARLPSREVVERLALALTLSEMEYGALLLAAGFAPPLAYMRHLVAREGQR